MLLQTENFWESVLHRFGAPGLREKLRIQALPPLNSHAEYEPKGKGA